MKFEIQPRAVSNAVLGETKTATDVAALAFSAANGLEKTSGNNVCRAQLNWLFDPRAGCFHSISLRAVEVFGSGLAPAADDSLILQKGKGVGGGTCT